MPELTSRSASSSGVASAASTIRASRPPPSRTMRPYARAFSGSKPSTAAPPSCRWASTSARIVAAVSPGTSPFRTSTSPACPASVSRAARTASPVPSGSCCTATSVPSTAGAPSGETTTTMRSTPASRAAPITQSTMRWPSSGCRCFGFALFMRVPRPAAMTTAASSSAMSVIGSWGARIRTWDHGTKTRCLTTWPRPRAERTLTTIREDVEERDHDEDGHRDDREPEDEDRENRCERGQELREREDPRPLMEHVRARPATGIPVDGDRGDCEREHGEARDVVEKRDEDRLDRCDPKRQAEPPFAQPAPCSARRRGDMVRLAQHVSTVPRWCRQPHAAEAAQRASRGFRMLLVMEEAVDRRTGTAHVGAECAELAEPLAERRACEIVRRQCCEIAGAADPVERVEQPRAALVPPRCAVALVERAIDGRGRRLRHPGRQDEQHEEILRQVQWLERRSVAGRELRPVVQEKGNVGTDLGGHVVQGIGWERLAERRVGEPKRGRGVRAAAAEARGLGQPFLDPRMPALRAVRAHREEVERVADERVAGEAVDARRRRGVDVDAVGDAHSLQHGQHLVLAVGPGRADHECEIDLRGRGSPHASARASSTNSGGASTSARVDAPRPIAASAATPRSRVAKPLSASEFGSVFRRCANAAATTSLIRAYSAGSATRRNATSAESTFGAGRNALRATGWKPLRSHTSCTSTETAPYALVAGLANRRSATSRCTITHHRRICGRPSMLSTRIGVATLYGRFATSFEASGAIAARSSCSASPKWSSTSPESSRRRGSSDLSTSTA